MPRAAPPGRESLSWSCIHLGGAGAPAQQVEAWLQRSGARVARACDAFELVARLVRAAEDIPDIVCLSGAALCAGDIRVVEYVRETWPATIILVYGASEPPPAVGLLSVYPDDALATLLEAPLARLIDEVRASAKPETDETD